MGSVRVLDEKEQAPLPAAAGASASAVSDTATKVNMGHVWFS